jgi:PA14 domain
MVLRCYFFNTESIPARYFLSEFLFPVHFVIKDSRIMSQPPVGFERGGLNSWYFNGRSGANVPTVQGLDRQVDFDWGYGSAAPGQVGNDNFGAYWKGKIQSAVTGWTKFFTTVDDGVYLKVGGQTVIDKWYDQAPTEHQGGMYLEAGKFYDIEMSYYEAGGGATMKLAWETPGATKQIVGAANLFYDLNQAAAAGIPRPAPVPALPNPTISAPALPTNLTSNFFTGSGEQRFGFMTTVTNTLTGKIVGSGTVNQFNFDFGNGGPVIGVTDNFRIDTSARFFVQKSGWYDFFTTADDGIKLSIDSEAVINNWQDQAPTTRQGGKWLEAGKQYFMNMNYYEAGGGATLKLEWSGPDTAGQRQSVTARNALTLSDRMPVNVGGSNMFEAYDKTGGDMTKLRQLYPNQLWF